MRIYLDSCVVTYLVENTPQAATVQQILANYHGSQACSSNLALLECLVAPLRDNDEVLVNAYKQFFRVCYRIPSRVQVFRVAAHLRATTNLRTPDALHLAYAHAGKCHIFLTGDKKNCKSMELAASVPIPTRGGCDIIRSGAVAMNTPQDMLFQLLAPNPPTLLTPHPKNHPNHLKIY